MTVLDSDISSGSDLETSANKPPASNPNLEYFNPFESPRDVSASTTSPQMEPAEPIFKVEKKCSPKAKEYQISPRTVPVKPTGFYSLFTESQLRYSLCQPI